MQLKTAGGSVTRNHGTGADTNLCLCDVCRTAVYLVDNRVDIIALALTLVPVLQTDIEGAGRRRLVKGRAATDGHVIESELRNILDATLHLAGDLSRHRHAGTWGTLHIHVDRAHILVGDKARLGGLEHIAQQHAHHNHRHPGQPPVTEDAQDTTLVLAHHTLEADIERLMESGREAGIALLAGTQHQSTEGRREGHGINGRDNNGNGHRHTKLGIEDSRGSAHKADGDEDAHEDNGGSDKG